MSVSSRRQFNLPALSDMSETMQSRHNWNGIAAKLSNNSSALQLDLTCLQWGDRMWSVYKKITCEWHLNCVSHRAIKSGFSFWGFRCSLPWNVRATFRLFTIARQGIPTAADTISAPHQTSRDESTAVFGQKHKFDNFGGFLPVTP